MNGLGEILSSRITTPSWIVTGKLKDILNEITGTKVKVKDLTFDLLKDTFPTKYQDFIGSDTRPMYRDAIYLPKGDGSSKGIIDAIALDNYKEYIMDRVGDVEILFLT